ncbi:MAG: ABC transporter ATP-binding protein [Gammaproteobacteria bacterium]
MRVSIAGLDKRFGSNRVLRSCALTVEDGELVTLLGPSGCGKTTLLRCLAGFELPEAGDLRIGDSDVTHLPPNKRNVGFVFQSYALFPHLTVHENVAYGLRIRRRPRAEVVSRVEQTLSLVSLAELADRYPSQLSGGQQQRVALARAIVLRPNVLLLDEAFNALDAKLRLSMQMELRKLVKRLAMTTICVTHDQIEALTISDRIAVMSSGCIEQIASADAIYDRPNTTFVADFIGAANVVRRTATEAGSEVCPGLRVDGPEAGPVAIVIRPENLRLDRSLDGDGWSGRISYVRLLGPSVEYEVQTERDGPLRALVARSTEDRGSARLSVGEQVRIGVKDAAACVVIRDPSGH